MKNNNLHGGDLDEISRIYNINKEDIINFSGNVNPLGLPKSVKEAIINKVDNITNYPDTEYLSLRKAIGNYTKCDFENIIVGNGSTELISGFIKFVKPKSAVVISPAYSEYLKEIKAQGADCVLYELKENEDFVLNIKGLFNVINENTDLLVICNPNNPTGSYITEDNLRVILNYCKKFNVKVMIDETYVEFSDRHIKVSAIGLIKDFDNLFIVRGTSKFFACPGVRLGYGICKNKETINYINSSKDLWSVNVFAEIAGETMFLDKDFIDKSISLTEEERMRFIMELGTFPYIKLYDSQSNFFLAKILRDDINSDFIFLKLIKEGILIRNCKDFPYLSDKFIRFCILSKNNNIKLIDNLKNILSKGVI